jgi:hypothetical protein
MNATRKLIKHKRLNDRLKKKGGPENDGKLFERILWLEERILESFGLKPTASNIKLLEYTDEFAPCLKCWAQDTADKLKEAAKEPANQNKSALEAILWGLKYSLPWEDVLPLMGLSTHEFLIYLYDRAVENESDVLDLFSEMFKSKDNLSEISLFKQEYIKLRRLNLNYLEDFLKDELESHIMVEREKIEFLPEGGIKNIFPETGLNYEDSRETDPDRQFLNAYFESGVVKPGNAVGRITGIRKEDHMFKYRIDILVLYREAEHFAVSRLDGPSDFRSEILTMYMNFLTAGDEDYPPEEKNAAGGEGEDEKSDGFWAMTPEGALVEYMLYLEDDPDPGEDPETVYKRKAAEVCDIIASNFAQSNILMAVHSV